MLDLMPEQRGGGQGQVTVGAGAHVMAAQRRQRSLGGGGGPALPPAPLWFHLQLVKHGRRRTDQLVGDTGGGYLRLYFLCRTINLNLPCVSQYPQQELTPWSHHTSL